MSPVDPQLLEDFRDGLRIMDRLGLTAAFGHLSARLTGEAFLMTPAFGPGMAGCEDLVILDLKGTRIGGAERPLALERFLHAGVYRSRPEVGAVCRTHSRACVSWGASGKPLPLLHGFGLMLGRTVPCFPEIDLVHDPESGERVAAALGRETALLLRGNGAFAVGDSLRNAVVHALYLEEAASIGLDLGIDGTRDAVSEADQQLRQRWHANERPRAWAYYRWKASGPEH